MGDREQRVLIFDLNEPPPEEEVAIHGSDTGEVEALVQSMAPYLDTAQEATAAKRSVPARMKWKQIATIKSNGGTPPTTSEDEDSDEDWLPDENDVQVQKASKPVSDMSAFATPPVKRKSHLREMLSKKLNRRDGNASPVPKKKIIHVHKYLDTGRWGAWFRVPSRPKSERIFLGTHLTKYLAARCQDRALLMHESQATTPVKLYFQREDYLEDEELRNILSPKECRRLLMLESRCNYVAVEPTPCLRKFLREELAVGKIMEEDLIRESVITLKHYFEELLQAQELARVPTDLIQLGGNRRTHSG